MKHILKFDSAMNLTLSRFSIFSMVGLWERAFAFAKIFKNGSRYFNDIHFCEVTQQVVTQQG